MGRSNATKPRLEASFVTQKPDLSSRQDVFLFVACGSARKKKESFERKKKADNANFIAKPRFKVIVKLAITKRTK